MDLARVSPAKIRKAALSYLSPEEIIKACAVNEQVKNSLCNDKGFWKALYRKDYSSFMVHSDYKEAYYKTYNELNSLQPDEDESIESTKNRYVAKHGLDMVIDDDASVFIDAAEEGNLQMIMAMLDRPIDKSMYRYALYQAARGGYENIVDVLIENFHQNFTIEDYNWAMVRATYAGNINIVKKMIDLGADNYDDAMFAATSHYEILKLLLDMGADYDKAINYAVRRGDQQLVNRIRNYKKSIKL